MPNAVHTLPPLHYPTGGWERPAALPRGGRCQVPFPGLWCHLSASAALQASLEALVTAADFLKQGKLKHLAQTEQTWKIAEYLVKTTALSIPQNPSPTGLVAGRWEWPEGKGGCWQEGVACPARHGLQAL